MSVAVVDAGEMLRLRQTYPAVFERPFRERATPWLALAATAGYLVFCFWFFDLVNVFGSANWTRAGIELAQWISYESRPELKLADGRYTAVFNRYDVLGPNPKPDWLRQTAPGEVTVLWGDVSPRLDLRASDAMLSKGAEQVHLILGPAGWMPVGPVPAWVKVQEGGAIASLGFAGTVELDKDSVRIRRRFLGWANFFFDQDSKLANRSAGEVIWLITSSPRLDAAQSNLSLAWRDFLQNSGWQHEDVFISLLQTIVMAFVGTLFAVAVGAPLSFLAARTVMPSRFVNNALKRFFDFQRCVDIFIWALFFTRGFGPGPLAGISAIFFTDTGTLGKTFTEALENIDDKPQEGIRSAGASPLQVQRYAVLPQVLPVFISQALYQWESNTRSATVIGAMGAGGIGLKLLEAMRTHSNWANVAYMVVLILIVVYVFDNISTWLRRRLISGGT